MPFQPLKPATIGNTVNQMIVRVLNNPLYGTPFDHYRARWLGDEAYDRRGRVDYLSGNSGDLHSGVTYTPNENNPLTGVFCPIARRPNQDRPGIFYEATVQLYSPADLGEVFVLDESQQSRPKLQDKFIVNQQVFYAAQPAFACMQGQAIACWRIDLALQRYPVLS